jgi:hypothetical protein
LSSPENVGKDRQMLKPPKSPMGPLVVMGLSIVLVLYVHTSLALAFMAIMRRRALKMGMPANK